MCDGSASALQRCDYRMYMTWCNHPVGQTMGNAKPVVPKGRIVVDDGQIFFGRYKREEMPWHFVLVCQTMGSTIVTVPKEQLCH
ncbi:MAG: hypothetical protein IJ242_02240 [Clostridia bacterium]|nr:hypothetical protein [Clostridia bacterium]